MSSKYGEIQFWIIHTPTGDNKWENVKFHRHLVFPSFFPIWIFTLFSSKGQCINLIYSKSCKIINLEWNFFSAIHPQVFKSKTFNFHFVFYKMFIMEICNTVKMFGQLLSELSVIYLYLPVNYVHVLHFENVWVGKLSPFTCRFCHSCSTPIREALPLRGLKPTVCLCLRD